MSGIYRRRCYYELCSADVEVRPIAPGEDGANYGLVQAHDILHGVLTGPCPGSRVYHPIDNRTKKMLHERYLVDASRIPQLASDAIDNELRQVKGGGGKPESTSLRGPHRLGREPDNAEKDDWQIGGRADEEIIPPDQVKTPRVPSDVKGTRMGAGSMLDELVGMIRDANRITNEGRTEIAEAIARMASAAASMNVALGSVATAQGDVGAALLEEYMGILRMSADKIQTVLAMMEELDPPLAAGVVAGEEYIGRLMS